MAKGLVQQDSLTNIAEAIRSKNGKTVQYTPAEMSQAILDIPFLDGFPIGGITAYSGENIPSGWLLCNGANISREDYSDLFDVVGTSFGSGDGSTTFALPDLTSKFIYGASDSSDFNEKGGEEAHTLTINEMPSHNHSLTAHGSDGTGNMVSQSIGNGGSRVVAGWVIGNTGGNQPHNNMPPYQAINYIIKAE